MSLFLRFILQIIFNCVYHQLLYDSCKSSKRAFGIPFSPPNLRYLSRAFLCLCNWNKLDWQKLFESIERGLPLVWHWVAKALKCAPIFILFSSCILVNSNIFYCNRHYMWCRYWYFGPLKHRLTYVISTVRHWPNAHDASLSYVLPCDGCAQCYVPPPAVQWKWWHILIAPKRQGNPSVCELMFMLCIRLGQRNICNGRIASCTWVKITQ